MSTGLPVIGTDIAFEGINVDHEKNARKANTAEEIAGTVRQLFNFHLV